MIYKHVGRSVVIFGSILKSNFWRVFDVFLDLAMQAYRENQFRCVLWITYNWATQRKKGP